MKRTERTETTAMLEYAISRGIAAIAIGILAFRFYLWAFGGV